ncbi:MAG: AMP-dependent synthetase/ligase [Motilibacteraceae bacterium]
MNEISVPPLLAERSTGNLADLVVDNAAHAPHRVVFSRKVGDRWQDVTAREFLAEVTDVAKGLVAAGIEPGQRVGLMSKTRYEWTLCDFAIWMAGGVTVPIYETSSAEQVQWILSDSGAVAAILESPKHAAVFGEVSASLPGVARTWVLDEGGLDELVSAGDAVPDADVEARRTIATPSSLATIIYTSGTTGRPKGVELTHGNFLAEVDNGIGQLEPLFRDQDASTLLFLPLAHVFARVIQVGCVISRTRMGHTADIKNLLDDFAGFQPTFILSVPRVFEKIYNSAEQKAQAGGKGKIFHQAAETAISYSESLDRGGAPLPLRLKHALFDRLVFAKLRQAMGGKVRYAVSGGAPLGTRLGHFFRGAGITVLEGYGLTETTAAATVNTTDKVRIGTVGRPIPGCGVRIAEDGEVMLKGGHVFGAYWRNPEASAEALTEDGWFHTGDIGELDDEGFLRITGRKKELIVTAGGKNVAPAVLEDRLRAHPLVSQCIVVGDNQPFIGALITLDEEALPTWLKIKGKPEAPAADLVADPDVVAEIQAAVDDANKAVSHAEAIKKFRILPVDFTEEGGQLTPSLKLKRSVVLKDFGAEVDALYA